MENNVVDLESDLENESMPSVEDPMNNSCEDFKCLEFLKNMILLMFRIILKFITSLGLFQTIKRFVEITN